MHLVSETSNISSKTRFLLRMWCFSFTASHICTLQSYAFLVEDDTFVVGWNEDGKVLGEINGEDLQLKLIGDMTEFVYGWHKHCFTYDSNNSAFMVCIFHYKAFVLHWLLWLSAIWVKQKYTAPVEVDYLNLKAEQLTSKIAKADLQSTTSTLKSLRKLHKIVQLRRTLMHLQSTFLLYGFILTEIQNCLPTETLVHFLYAFVLPPLHMWTRLFIFAPFLVILCLITIKN